MKWNGIRRQPLVTSSGQTWPVAAPDQFLRLPAERSGVEAVRVSNAITRGRTQLVFPHARHVNCEIQFYLHFFSHDDFRPLKSRITADINENRQTTDSVHERCLGSRSDFHYFCVATFLKNRSWIQPICGARRPSVPVDQVK